MVKHVKGLSKLNTAVEKLKEIAEEVRENLDKKKEWLNEKSEKYQDSDEGNAWIAHFDELEVLLDEIYEIEYVF